MNQFIQHQNSQNSMSSLNRNKNEPIFDSVIEIVYDAND